MFCFNHPQTGATGQCVDCGRGLCQECTILYKPILCTDCAKTRNHKELVKCIATLGISIVLFIIAFIYNGNLDSPWHSTDLGMRIFASLFLAGIPWGWITLNKITPQIFLFLPIIGWVIYFMIKLTIASFIGIFALFIKGGITIYKIVRTVKMKEYIINN